MSSLRPPSLVLLICSLAVASISGAAFAAPPVLQSAPDAAAVRATAGGDTLPAHAVVDDSIAVWLEFPDTIRAGESVPLELKVRNVSDRLVTLSLAGGTGPGGRQIISYEFWITRPDGKLVWKNTHRAPTLAGKTLLSIAAGATVTLYERWDQRVGTWDVSDHQGTLVPPGRFHVRGFLHGAPLTFTTARQPLVVMRPR